MYGSTILTKEQAAAEIATWSALYPIHVGAGWHGPIYGGNAVVRLLRAAGACVDLLTDEKGHGTLAVNGLALNPWGTFAGHHKVMAEIERVLGLPCNVVHAILQMSDRFTYFDARPEVMDFVTDHQRGTEEIKLFVERHVLNRLPREERVA